MSPQDFHIQQFRFDVDFFSKEKAYDLQSRISRLFWQQLQSRTQSVFDNEIRPDVLLQADSVVLDLGNVSYENFENDITAKFDMALTDFFSKLSINPTATDSGGNRVQIAMIPLSKSHLHILENFLLTGALLNPTAGGVAQLEKNLEELFSREALSLSRLIRSAGQMEAVRKRLAYQFSEAFIRSVVALLEPSEADFIFKYKEDIQTTQQQSTVVTIDTDHFQKDIWTFILTFLLVEKDSSFNRKEFLRSTLRQIAARYNISYEEFMDYLGKSLLSGNPNVNKTELLQLIALLTGETIPVQGTYRPTVEKETRLSATPGRKETQEEKVKGLEEKEAGVDEPVADKKRIADEDINALQKELRWLYHYFRHGSFPKEADTMSRIEWADLIAALLRSRPDDLNWVLSQFSRAVIAKRGYDAGGELLASSLDVQYKRMTTEVHVSHSSLAEMLTAYRFTLQQKEDILYHFLYTGYLPWWASGQPVSVHVLLEEVCLSSPRKTAELLQWAGENSACKERFLSQFYASVTQVFAILPEGEKSVRLFTLLLTVLPEGSTKQTIFRRFTEALWSSYDSCRYEAFSEMLFMVDAGREIRNLYHLPPGAFGAAFLRFMEDKDAGILQNVIHHLLKIHDEGYGREVNMPESFNTAIPGEELIVLLLSYANENRNGEMETVTDGYNKPLLQTALIQSLSYFFIHHRFPGEIESRASASPLQLCKEALLLLHNLSPAETESLLLSSLRAKEEQLSRLMNIFREDEYREKELLLMLYKIHFRESSPLLVEQPENGASLDSGTTPLLQQHYLPGGASFEKKKETAKVILSYFLAWNKLPQGEGSTLPATEAVVKELVLFLFIADRTALQSLLQSGINIPKTIIRLADMVKVEKGGAEALAARFVKPYIREAALDCLWEDGEDKEQKSSKKDSTETILLPDIFSLLSDTSGEGPNEEEQVALWLDYFLLHHSLPPALLRYPAGETVMSLTRFLMRRNKSLLSTLVQKETHLPAARMGWYDWLEGAGNTINEELQPLITEAVQRDVAAYLQQASQTVWQEPAKHLLLLWKSHLTAEEKKTFLQAITRHTTAREAWVASLPLTELHSVLKDTHSRWAKQYIHILKLLEKVAGVSFSPGYEQEQFRLQGKVFLLLLIAGTVTVIDPASFISQFFIYLDQRRPSFVPRLYQNIQEQWEKVEHLLGDDHSIKKEIHKAVAVRLPTAPAVLTKEDKQKQSLKQIALKKQKEEVEKRYAGERKALFSSSLIEEENRKPKLHIDTGTKLYVNNAGIILLHPLIPTLFMLTGLTEKNQFINNDAQKRAVLLLQYVATNATVHEEPGLVLNKIICGLPLEEPVPASIALTEKERQVTTELFTIIFQRWERMKNATADNFRHSFLQREGILSKSEEAWKMRIEPRGYDMLLQTLPWAFGVTKLPWMPLPVETEWI